MKWIRYVSALGLVMFGAGCGTAAQNSTANQLAQQTGFQAICNLEAQSTAVVCMDFPANVAANQSACNTTEVSNYAAEGVSGAEYVAVSGSGVTTSCQQTNTSLSLLGSCILSDRAIRYYTNAWSVTNAQSNCTSRGGQWSS